MMRRDARADTQEDKAFDVLTRELVFEAKAQPGERTLTGARTRRERLRGVGCGLERPAWRARVVRTRAAAGD